MNEVNGEKTGEADEVNLEVDSKYEVLAIVRQSWQCPDGS